MDREQEWDKRLEICTTGRDDVNADEYRYPYEPTPYSVLERLADSGLIRSDNVVLDYGCCRKSENGRVWWQNGVYAGKSGNI